MKKMLAALAVVMVLGATTFSGAPQQPQEAEADVLAAAMIPKTACIALLTGALGGIAIGCLDSPEEFHDKLNLYAEDFGDEDGDLEIEDLAPIETFGGRQLHDQDGYAYVIVFVSDQAPVRFRIDSDGGAFNVGTSAVAQNVNEFICDSEDSDCNNTDDPEDNGFIVIGLCSGVLSPGCTGGGGAEVADRGAHNLAIDQERVPVDISYTVVGEADDIRVGAFETTINNGVVDKNGDGDLNDSDECPLQASVAGFTAALNQGEKTVVIGRVSDDDGQDITNAWIAWDTDDHDIGDFTSTRETPTLNLGSFGIGAPQILCGTDKPGILELQANVVGGPSAASGLDPSADETIDTTLQVTVRGVPASVDMSVTPASINCDGVQSAEVSATVRDANGDLVANGQQVDWSVQVLGTASPLTSSTTDGIAKTLVVPLSGNRGVPVVATAGDEQGSILVNCGGTAAGPAPAPPPTGPGAPPSTGGGGSGSIGGPDTGSGGYLGTGDDSLPMWPALPILAVLGAMIAFRARAGARR
jgi:hypothetical protein